MVQAHTSALVEHLRRLGQHHENAHHRARAAATAHKAPGSTETGDQGKAAPEATNHGA